MLTSKAPAAPDAGIRTRAVSGKHLTPTRPQTFLQATRYDFTSLFTLQFILVAPHRLTNDANALDGAMRNPLRLYRNSQRQPSEEFFLPKLTGYPQVRHLLRLATPDQSVLLKCPKPTNQRRTRNQLGGSR